VEGLHCAAHVRVALEQLQHGLAERPEAVSNPGAELPLPGQRQVAAEHVHHLQAMRGLGKLRQHCGARLQSHHERAV